MKSLKIFGWNYYDREIEEDEFLWEDVDDHYLEEIVSSLAACCPKLARVNFCVTETLSPNITSLDIDRKEGRYDIILAGRSYYHDHVSPSAWHDL